LPWPCWNEEHPGTPILYRNDIPVWEGGHDFRVKWGAEHDGESMLAENGHDQVTIDGIIWSKNLETDYKDILDQNMVPSGRGRARFYAWNMKDAVPVHREPVYSPRPDLIDRYPVYDESVYGEYHYRTKILSRTLQIAFKRVGLRDYFPLAWTSGRQVEHQGGGATTRNNRILSELQPEMYVEINPEDAAARGIKDGDMVVVLTPRGLEYGAEPAKVICKARITNAVAKGLVFMPFHWAGYFEGESYLNRFPMVDDMDTKPFVAGDSANIVNSPGWDPETQMQNTKAGICEILKLSEFKQYKLPPALEKYYEEIVKQVR
jgi:formate dehydrogenase major subunit